MAFSFLTDVLSLTFDEDFVFSTVPVDGLSLNGKVGPESTPLA